jgi:hypothetical protein
LAAPVGVALRRRTNAGADTRLLLHSAEQPKFRVAQYLELRLRGIDTQLIERSVLCLVDRAA